MKNLMTMDSRPFRWMSHVWDLIVLNLLMLLCSLPIVTIGASVTAVCEMSMRLQRKEEGASLIVGFFSAFRNNFRKATLLWLACLLGTVICIGDVSAASYFGQPALLVAAGVTWIVLFAMVQYLFPLQARFENTCRGTVKNALMLTLARLPYTLIMMALSVSPFIAILVSGRFRSNVITLCCILWFAAVVDGNCRLLKKTFDLLIPQKHTSEKGETEAETLALLAQVEGGRPFLQ